MSPPNRAPFRIATQESVARYRTSLVYSLTQARTLAAEAAALSCPETAAAALALAAQIERELVGLLGMVSR